MGVHSHIILLISYEKGRAGMLSPTDIETDPERQKQSLSDHQFVISRFDQRLPTLNPTFFFSFFCSTGV
jgi:hypothetical protein